MSNLVNISEVAARTKLAVLNTGRWQATRQHRKETIAVNDAHGTKAAKVLVRVSDHPALTAITKLHAEAYQEHRRLTLPSAQDGMRMLPAGREFEHAEVMRKLGDRHNALVEEFLADYESERKAAPARLNGLYDASMWPSKSQIADKFSFRTRYLPTPADGAWGEWLEASAEEAEKELRGRVEEALKRVRDRCKADGKLYASVFDSIRDLVSLVPDLDFSGEYAPVVKAMEPLATIHAEDIRDDAKARQKVAKQTSDILSVLGGIK
jgi:hypothetical protein